MSKYQEETKTGRKGKEKGRKRDLKRRKKNKNVSDK
jgi:hypothetical protein